MLQLHPFTVRALVLLVLFAAVSVGATAAYVGSAGRTQSRAATTHVREAATAAEAWFQDPLGGSGSYRGLGPAALAHEAPSVSPAVHVTVLAGGAAFCLDDEEAPGRSAYYLGGSVGRLHRLGGAAVLAPTAVVSKTTDAADVCRGVR
jgi:hypothetical protein